nr:integrase, catalytic region, zinc finger, CCHC-type, peptidase aspartic, catalytic [Tanacetum cinerariifolium]
MILDIMCANELQHSEQSESICNTCLVETNNSNVIPDSPDMCDDDIQNDQNDVDNDDERPALANLIANLKLDVDKNKKIQKQLKKANTTLTQELKECKTILAENSKTLEESKSVRDNCLVALQNKQTEFAKYKAFNDRTVDYEKFERKLNETLGQLAQKDIEIKKVALQNKQTEFAKYKAFNDRTDDYEKFEQIADNAWKHTKDQFHAPTAKDMEILIQTCLMPLALKTQNDSFIFVHEHKQEMHADIKQRKAVETKIDKPYVVRQPNAQRIPKPSVLGKPAPFSDSVERRYFSKTKSVPKTNVLEGLSKPVTTQTLPQTARQAVSNTNVLKPGMYQIDNRTTQTRGLQSPQTVRNTNPHVPTFTGVNHKTNVSRPQYRSNQMKDKVVPNNSQVKLKKTQVEDHPRIPSISNKIKTKKPNVVPISTRKPKGHANKSVATPHNKKVASKSTTQKPKSYYRMLYEKTSKAWKWWIEKQCPSGYKWASKTKMQWVPKARNENVQKRIVQLILFIVDSGCTKHMTGNLKLLCNFVEKFLGTVCFGNDQFALILGYGVLVQGNITINRVYYVESLNHNLFSVGQFVMRI